MGTGGQTFSEQVVALFRTVQLDICLKASQNKSPLLHAVNRTYPGAFPLISWEGQIKEAFAIVVIESK